MWLKPKLRKTHHPASISLLEIAKEYALVQFFRNEIVTPHFRDHAIGDLRSLSPLQMR
jgi:hypothetical protein